MFKLKFQQPKVICYEHEQTHTYIFDVYAITVDTLTHLRVFTLYNLLGVVMGKLIYPRDRKVEICDGGQVPWMTIAVI